MHWTALLEKRYFPPHATIIDDLPCVSCGYNLRAARVAGVCPECGQPVSDSLWALARPDQVASGLRSIGKSYLGLFGLILVAIGSITNPWAGWVGAIILIATAIIRAFGVAELRFRAAIDQMPVIGRRVRVLWPLSVLEVVVTIGGLASLLIAQWNMPVTSWSEAAVVLPGAAWLCTTFAAAVMAGSMGAALAALLGYESVVRELRAQYILLLALLPLVIVLSLAGWLLSILFQIQRPAMMLSVLPMFLLLCLVVALGLTFTGMLHLANGAERERDPLDHLVDAPRTHYVPDRSNDDQDDPPSIKMES